MGYRTSRVQNTPCAPGVGRSNLHVGQNLIFMASLIPKLEFCLVNVFFFKNVWLALSSCYYMDRRRCRMCVVVFPHFIMASKNYA